MDQREKKQPCLDFVLLGKTGSGKSASGNTLLGRKAFVSKKNPTSVTREIKVEHGTVQGLSVTVYDTPGFFDTELNDEEIKEKCQSVFSKCKSDLTVFLLVIKADRFTEEERRTVEKIEKLLGPDLLEKTWILFTRGDELEEENQTIKEFIWETPELKKLTQRYQKRYHVFNNKNINERSQVQCLLTKICLEKFQTGSVLERTQLVEPQNSSGAERRIVLLGKAGTGKSASGNTILGQSCFKSEFGLAAVTKESTVQPGNVAGRNVSVVDTPGLFDAEMDQEKLITEIARCVYLCSPGPHALLITLPLTGRFTAQEKEVIQNVKVIFGKEVLKYAILLFTNGDRLKGKAIEELIENNSALRELVQECGGRYHVFNNEDKNNRQQVTDLLEKIDKMVEQNDRSCYSNEMLKEAANCRRQTEDSNTRENEQKGGSDSMFSDFFKKLMKCIWDLWFWCYKQCC